MDVSWTLSELVAEAAGSIETLPAPKNGQVRAVPDERTVRYYGTIGLLDRPIAMRGRTALYGRKHLAQVVAIKRLQGAGQSLAEIQAVWPTLTDATLARMTGIELGVVRESKGKVARRDFWKREPAARAGSRPNPNPNPNPIRPTTLTPNQPVVGFVAPITYATPLELRIELAPGAALALALDDLTFDPSDLRALRAAAAPLVAELARRGLIAHEGAPKETQP